MKPKYKVNDMVINSDNMIGYIIIDVGVYSYLLKNRIDGYERWVDIGIVESELKTFREICTELADEWVKDGGYDCYDSILEFLDSKFGRDDYLRMDGNALIHEKMRCELDEVGKGYSIVVSGLMECYDFCHQTKDMNADEIANFVNFRD